MKQFLITVAGVITGLLIFGVIFFLIIPMIMIAAVTSTMQTGEHKASADAAERIVLTLDLREPRLDQPSGAPFAFAEAAPLTKVVETLARAENDDKVKGLYIRANEFGMPPAQAAEIRQAILSFRESGKYVLAHSQGFNSTSVIPYMAVSAADEIWMQDTSQFAATGMSSEAMFLGGAFEKFDAQSQIFQIAEYKNAANTYNETGFTEAHRESLTSMLTSLYNTALSAAAADRATDPRALRALIEDGPYSAEAAVEAGLADRMGQAIEAENYLLQKAGEDASLIELADYARTAEKAFNSGPTIAFVGGQGAIVTGDTLDYTGPFGGGDYMGSDTVAAAILEAAEDDDVKAIVFRVDSPGGNVVASDQIWDAVERAQAAGKPVVVSMGSLAASGGYYVSAGADRILALPNTLTGSIGIFGGKIVTDGTLELVGLNVEPLSVGGEFAGAYTSQRLFTPYQAEAVRESLENGYLEFTSRVAEGRDMDLDLVQQIAKGRVWTGQQALERGLVDELGGLRAAIGAAKELAGIEADESITLKTYPHELTEWQKFQRLFGASGETAQALIAMKDIVQMPEVQAALRARAAAGQNGQAQAQVEPLRVR